MRWLRDERDRALNEVSTVGRMMKRGEHSKTQEGGRESWLRELSVRREPLWMLCKGQYNKNKALCSI
jgi:hypothetical protein